jgi:ubiquinone/menaquinone biosynthesis C-methylase UbiE
VSAPLPITRAAYKAQQTALRLSLVAAHIGLRPLVPPRQKPTRRDLFQFRRRLQRLLERDVANVRAGLYPETLLFSLPLGDYLRGLPSLMLEIARMVRRRDRGLVRDLPSDVDLSRYPDYFRRNFHWQTDGYLSERSARLYDLGVEFLFLGTADVMRRQVIAPISKFLRESTGERALLDVGCGTGRLLQQLALAHPNLRRFGVDLSPYYIEHAKAQLGEQTAALSTGNAEALAFAAESFDVVTSVFMFHELPLRARRQALAEMRRVAKPGALLVLEDSAQLEDAPELEIFLENFGYTMNEPFFHDYLRQGLEAEVERAGFRIESVEPAFLSKVIVARAV